ncbi:hypothetical protein N577_013085 [Lacticaseibacillus rhamnosus 2166]|nr:hypothetical protein N577_013085 [Lacticaseibacillus rhamnosus 2166]
MLLTDADIQTVNQLLVFQAGKLVRSNRGLNELILKK